MKSEIIHPFFFDFESDFVESLRCIPMIVRYKLDTCGIKLKLPEWVKISVAEKKQLAYLPCYTLLEIQRYANYVESLVWKYTDHAASPLPMVDDNWNNLSQIPNEITEKSLEWHCPALTLKQWIGLDTLQRFALVKLSRSGHEGKNLPKALREFGIL
jgi:hypothetical protein